MHANILLNTNDMNASKKTDIEISEIFGISKTTVNNIRKEYATSGIEAVLERKTRISAPVLSKITGEFEAQVIATALSPAPNGYARWTLRLLAEHCMERKYIISISHSAIGEMLNTNEVKPHMSEYWCVPKENDAHFVAHMENILNIYQIPYNQHVPVICMDEKPIQLLDEIRERITAKPLICTPNSEILHHGTAEKIDYKYERCGTACIFVFCEPLAGWRFVRALETCKKGDFALLMREISDVYFPNIEKIIIVADNLNTHNVSSFYEAFEPKTAFRLARKFEFHYTPKHGSWLNIAESELGSLAVQALGNRRINSLGLLNEILTAWQSDRNSRQKGVNWHFTAENARIKLKRLYPKPIFV